MNRGSFPCSCSCGHHKSYADDPAIPVGGEIADVELIDKKLNTSQSALSLHSSEGVSTYENLGLDPSVNIVVHYDRSRTVYPGTLKPFPSPSLKGVSGGAILSWPKRAFHESRLVYSIALWNFPHLP